MAVRFVLWISVLGTIASLKRLFVKTLAEHPDRDVYLKK